MAWFRKEKARPNPESLCDVCDLKDKPELCSDQYKAARQAAGECAELKARYDGMPMNVDRTHLYLQTGDGPLDTYSRDDLTRVSEAVQRARG